MIYDKEPIEVIWDLVKPLLGEIEVYKRAMDEDEDSIPDSYILLRSDVTDTPKIFGDGRTLIRSSDCDIILVTKGVNANSNDLHNINKTKVDAVLDSAGINYASYDLGYDDKSKSTQHTWNVTITYQK